MKSRIEALKKEIESGSSKLDLESYSPYDVADVVKQYLRELPEPLLTSKLAETFISIYKGEFLVKMGVFYVNLDNEERSSGC